MSFIKRDKLWESVAKEAYKAQKKRKEYEEMERELLSKLKQLSSEQSSEAGGFRFQRIERKGAVKYSAIPALQNINLDEYRSETPVVSWKLFRY